MVEANGWRTVAQEDERAIELSRLLQTPAIHPRQGRRPDFRNPAGVERKTSDIMSRHPDYRGTPTNGNHLDAEVLQDFLNDPAGMRDRASSIREILETWNEVIPALSDLDAEDPGVDEGGLLLKEHLRRERDPKLKTRKIADAKRRGLPIACEACGFDFRQTYGDRGRDYIECHHRTPLGVSGQVKTRLEDLALICSNCHRIIHRTKHWLTIDDLCTLIEENRFSHSHDV